MDTTTTHPIQSARDDRVPPGVNSLSDVSQEELQHAVAAQPDLEPLPHGAKHALHAEPGTDAYKREALEIPSDDQIKHDRHAKSKEHALASRDHQIMQQVEKEHIKDSGTSVTSKVSSAFRAMGHKIASAYHSSMS